MGGVSSIIFNDLQPCKLISGGIVLQLHNVTNLIVFHPTSYRNR